MFLVCLFDTHALINVFYLICKDHDTCMSHLLFLCCVIIAVLVIQGINTRGISTTCLVWCTTGGQSGLIAAWLKSLQSLLTHQRSTQISHDALGGQIFPGKGMLQDLYTAWLALLFGIDKIQQYLIQTNLNKARILSIGMGQTFMHKLFNHRSDEPAVT